jgi:hypothetical protein
MGAAESSGANPVVRVVAAPSARGEDEDILALRALRPYKQLVQVPAALPFATQPLPQLQPVSLNPALIGKLITELHTPLRTSEALVLENQRVLQHNIYGVEALSTRVATGTRKHRKDLADCRAHCAEIEQLESVLTEARARLASALDSTERLRRSLPSDLRPPPFDPHATTVFTPAGTRPSGLAPSRSSSRSSSLRSPSAAGPIALLHALNLRSALAADADSDSDDFASD